MVILESNLSARAFDKKLETPLLMDLARVLVFVLGMALLLRFQDLSRNGALDLLFVNEPVTWLFWVEILLGMVVPIVLLAIPRVRANQQALFLCSLLAVLGFIANRLNVAITGMESYARVNYFPSWMEISVTLMLVALGFAAFRLAVRYLPIFGKPLN